MAKNNLFLYLARRDKKGIRLLTKLQGEKQIPVRLNELSGLNLPKNLEDNINKIIFESRMEWEPWLQSAESIEDLRKHLHNRGYANVHHCTSCEIKQTAIFAPQVRTGHLPYRISMIRKKS